MDQIIEKAKNDKTHSSIPFWSWNDKLEEDELRRQIQNMKELGMQGFFMHARGGLETEYMSDDWFRCVRACIDEAKKYGMKAWAYDENGWPSGFADGKVLEDPKNHAGYLTCENCSSFPEPCENILGVYTVNDSGAIRHSSPCNADHYVVIRRMKDFSYVDVLNPDVAKEFIRTTHEVYKQKLGGDFGDTVPGFFTDEPQYYREATPWSDTFLTVFAKRFGYDVLDMLPALFLDYSGAEEFRYDYHLLLSECYIQNFAKTVYDWCEENGVQLTGHTVEEWGLTSQMAWSGGVMPFYRYQHIPGIDYLGRSIKSMVGVKQLSSVCEQLGKPVRLSEMFGCCGWNVTPLELKRIADLQFSGGVNLICEHLYAYSERGQRKRDYPNHYSEHNPWQNAYKDFVTYYSHLGSILSQGNELVDTLVIHPMHSAYLNYKHNDYSTISELNVKFTNLSKRLSGDQVLFHYGDEGMLKDFGEVIDKTIRIGNCSYDKVIIPYSFTLDSSTVKLLKQYLQNGGKLYLWDHCPNRIDGRIADLSFLRSNITYDQIVAESKVTVSCDQHSVPINLYVRTTNKGRIFYLANPSEKEYKNILINVKNCPGLSLLDPLTLKRSPLRGKTNTDGSVSVLYDFADSGSCLLIEENSEYLAFTLSGEERTRKLDSMFEVSYDTENVLLLHEAQISLNGKDFSDIRSIEQIRDELLRMQFKGDVTLRFNFTTNVIPHKLIFVAEPMQYKEVTINGIKINLSNQYSRIDRSFVGADIASLVVPGENKIQLSFHYFQRDEVYQVLYGPGGEALRNRLSFDTEIENVYLFGSFGVMPEAGFDPGDAHDTYRGKGPYILTERPQTVNVSDIVRNGYPFFAGNMTLHSKFSFQEGEPTLLHLDGHFAVCKVTVNGCPLNSSAFDRVFELKPYLRAGVNSIELEICFSNRNLLGPHHSKEAEPSVVSPKTFSFENQWENGHCSSFVPELAFVKFGVNFL